MREGTSPEDTLPGDTVEVHITLQAIASVDNRIGVTRTELSQTGRQQLILTLSMKKK